jgi:hypothetical protein
MRLVDATVVLRSDVVCRATDWDLDRISRVLWRRDLEREAFEDNVHEWVLAVWNASDLQGLEVFGDFILGAFESVDAALSGSEDALSNTGDRLACVTRIANQRIHQIRRRLR